jgi:hypothetical protein
MSNEAGEFFPLSLSFTHRGGKKTTNSAEVDVNCSKQITFPSGNKIISSKNNFLVYIYINAEQHSNISSNQLEKGELAWAP